MTSDEMSVIVARIRSALLSKPAHRITDPSLLKLHRAAVAVLLRPDARRNDLFVLLLLRKANKRDPWSSQTAFPGGHFDPHDKDVSSTALRELLEETGIELQSSDLITPLDEVLPTTLPEIRVTPFVALTPPHNMPVKIEEAEIESFVWIPLSFLMKEENVVLSKMQFKGSVTEVPSYRFLGQYVIWGMSYRIIRDLITKIGKI